MPVSSSIFFSHTHHTSIDSTCEHVCLVYCDMWVCFSMSFFLCVFCQSHWSSPQRNPPSALHLSAPHAPAASPAIQMPDLKNPVLTLPPGNNWHHNDLFTPLLVLPARPAWYTLTVLITYTYGVSQLYLCFCYVWFFFFKWCRNVLCTHIKSFCCYDNLLQSPST